MINMVQIFSPHRVAANNIIASVLVWLAKLVIHFMNL
jgi:hypothetical protein